LASRTDKSLERVDSHEIAARNRTLTEIIELYISRDAYFPVEQ